MRNLPQVQNGITKSLQAEVFFGNSVLGYWQASVGNDEVKCGLNCRKLIENDICTDHRIKSLRDTRVL